MKRILARVGVVAAAGSLAVLGFTASASAMSLGWDSDATASMTSLGWEDPGPDGGTWPKK